MKRPTDDAKPIGVRFRVSGRLIRAKALSIAAWPVLLTAWHPIHYEQHPLKPEGERQQPFKPAMANRAPKATVLPGSNLDAFDNFGPTRGNRSLEKEEHKPSERLNEDYLETPTYLRKKAN